ncbi:S8 family serine peptidase [Metabacillus sp. 84]|uniref:S8 family serine peptidase n=1 Tax=unclassified Metabacillus TaxID=2675274 RepID=UPI003CEA0EDB
MRRQNEKERSVLRMGKLLRFMIVCCVSGLFFVYLPQQAEAASFRYLAELKGEPSQVKEQLKPWRITKTFSLDGRHYAVLTGSGSIRKLKKNPVIISAQHDLKTSGAAAFKAPRYSQQISWGVKNSQSHRLASKPCACKIAIVDSGIAEHEDLKGRVISRVSFINGEKRGMAPDTGKLQHGTHIAGIIGANFNTFGSVGMVPEAKLLAVKVLDENDEGYASDQAAGIAWAANNGADIINVSLSDESGRNEITEQVLKSAYNKGVVIIAASGNKGKRVEYPASSPYTISVGAVDQTNRIASFSSFGSSLDLLAPGVDIRSTVFKSSYKNLSGTSQAAPHAAGGAAKLLPLYHGPKNGARVEWVRKRLKDYGDLRRVTVNGRAYKVPVLNVYKSYYGIK